MNLLNLRLCLMTPPLLFLTHSFKPWSLSLLSTLAYMSSTGALPRAQTTKPKLLSPAAFIGPQLKKNTVAKAQQLVLHLTLSPLCPHPTFIPWYVSKSLHTGSEFALQIIHFKKIIICLFIARCVRTFTVDRIAHHLLCPVPPLLFPLLFL